MFICSFIDIIKLTYCKYINFLFSLIGISFAFRKFIHFCIDQKSEKGARRCQRSFGDFQRDGLVKTDAELLGYTVYFIKDLKEEGRRKTDGRIEKDEMVGLESTSGQV